MYYDSIYGTNNSKLTKELFDVNKQIASGLKIEYAKDNVRTFTETMRLDNEVTTLGQIKKSTQSGYKVSNQTDEAMNEFNSSMNRMRTLLIQAANGSNDDISLDAIADELRGIEKNLKGLANTSINGQFLFSGSAVNTKPIDEDGIYHGNNKAMNAFIGSNNKQQYNLTGDELFLGEESTRKREISSNTKSTNLIEPEKPLNQSSTLRELMGDKNGISPNIPVFYLRGTRSDGTAFKTKIDTLSDTDTITSLLEKIEDVYGDNTVNVSLNDNGEIVVQDKLKGSSKLDFHMVGAIDYTDSTAGSADQTDIDALDSGETTYPPSKNLYVKEFSKSGLVSPTAIEGLTYDRVEFTKKGSILSSNVSQVLKDYNAFAAPSTKISEVADTSKGTVSTADDTLDDTQFVLKGKDINGNDYNYTIVLDKNDPNDSNKNGSYFTPDGGNTKYHIYDMDINGRKAVDADEMTYQQLLDTVNMIVTKSIPSSDSADAYDQAIQLSDSKAKTELSYDGKITFDDYTSANTQATISLYDENTNDFTKPPSVMTFNSNNALTITDPKTDFFKSIDEIITSVEDHKLYPDSSTGHPRNIGIENAIQKIDDLENHLLRMHSKVGAQSNTLNMSLERTQILEVSTMSLRSSVIDTDLAESSLRLSQLNTNYQAMLSTVGRISKLSLVNYL
jgi:flagellar hook-associated protein 3 FlgL